VACLAAILLLIPARVDAAGSNWMSSAAGDLPLTRFSIPGTHDAGALYEPLSGTTKCQILTLAEQLNAGVRFLDIRCRHVNNAFLIHHGLVYQKMNFDDVLNTVIGFLTNNPAETVIMSVKEEYDPKGNTRSFEATFDSYVAKNPGKWLLTSSIPTLDQARGKIVLFRRFSAASTPKGIDLSVWPDDAAFTNANVRVQDNYNVTNPDSKWTAITNLLTEAQAGGPDTLYVNFASGVTKRHFLPDIPAVANAINPSLTNYFSLHTKGRYGVILLDFADADKCALIYRTAP
jgi:1-phosphatidylinositol phosphodiesterase